MNKQAFENLLQTSDPVTPQEISDFDQYRKLKRESLFLFQKPIKTIVTFLHGVAYFTTHCIRYIFSHQLFLFFVIPLCVLWPLARNLPEPYALWVKSIEFYFEYIVWWVGLGVLSSVGLGSGLQSGVLFLFPHIIKVSLAAQTCNTLDFESSSDMWFRNPPNLFRCPDVAANSTPVTFIGIWQKIILVCFLQSTGTAIGEIPPYWMTKSARIASLQTQHSLKEEFPEELEANSSYSIVNRGKVFLIWFLNKYGFYGVLIMASYPNIAFDLCGICCGHFLMPFWSFFIATFLGKAVIRNSYQSFFYVMICSQEYLNRIVAVLQYWSPDSWHLDEYIKDMLEQLRESFHHNLNDSSGNNQDSYDQERSSNSSKLLFWWQLFMTIVLGAFFLSCISHFAQYYQLVIDRADSEKLRKRLHQNIRVQITSPSTGRLKLPPPTPYKSKRSDKKDE